MIESDSVSLDTAAIDCTDDVNDKVVGDDDDELLSWGVVRVAAAAPAATDDEDDDDEEVNVLLAIIIWESRCTLFALNSDKKN